MSKSKKRSGIFYVVEGEEEKEEKSSLQRNGEKKRRASVGLADCFRKEGGLSFLNKKRGGPENLPTEEKRKQRCHLHLLPIRGRSVRPRDLSAGEEKGTEEG